MTTLTTTDLPTRADCWHDESTVISGNALAPTVDAGQTYAHYTYQNASANGDIFTQSVFLRAGSYTLSVLGETTANSGLADWYFDGAPIVTGQDWYSGATVRNVIKTSASFTVADDGYHILRGTVNGQNGASGGFDLKLTKMWFKQAAD
ncbi:MAG TPA: hypothetical protein VII92_19170 [Anaerolineae bacterium]